MDMKDDFTMFAAYNAWANGRLYDAAAALDVKQWRAETGAFFGSMMGTLNHILVADRIWMKRFTGRGEAPDRLDAIVHETFQALREAREAEDARIRAWVATLDVAALDGSFSYTRVSDGTPVTQRLGPALAHFFNHQTHHRGQAHMILSVLGHTPPALDLLFFHRAEAGRAFA